MDKRNKLEEFLVNLDIFGHQVAVNYKGNSVYQTHLGAVCTLIKYILIAVNFITISTAYRDGSKQEEKNRLLLEDRFFGEPLYLEENDFDLMFFLTFDLPPEIGRMKVKEVKGVDLPILD